AVEGETAPAERDRFRLGARLDRAQAPAPGVGEQLLAADVTLLEAGVAEQAAEVGGGEGVDVDLALKRVSLRLLVLGDAALPGPDRSTPDRRQRQAGALRQRRQGVAVARGLAGEGDHPARPQNAAEFGESLVEVGDVVE